MTNEGISKKQEGVSDKDSKAFADATKLRDEREYKAAIDAFEDAAAQAMRSATGTAAVELDGD